MTLKKQRTPTKLSQVLLEAIHECSSRGLVFASKWASELIVAVNEQAPMVAHASAPFAPNTTLYAFQNAEEDYRYQLAKSYFDMKEYARARHVLDSSATWSPKSIFLRLFSQYMGGEKALAESAVDIFSTTDNGKAFNAELDNMAKQLRALTEQHPQDGFLAYIYGVVLRKQKLFVLAVEALVVSVTCYPYNWSAWMELAALITSQDQAERVAMTIPDSFMKSFFVAHLSVELQRTDEAVVVRIFDELAEWFPRSTYLIAQRGLYFYNQRQFEAANQVFEYLRQLDPYNVDHMDIYSNILFVNEDKAKLSALAHECVRVDKYRPETCCIVGNYYSLRGEHEKAVIYFKRALRLNRNYLSAWTLMGHEFLEMSNTNAALEAYRRAIDINPRDYRAWFGLGQSYEMLRMNYYSVYYYQQAATLRPSDPRMWSALGSVYAALEQHEDALNCYKRALSGRTVQNESNNEGDEFSEQDVQILLRMAQIHEKLGGQDLAALCFRAALNSHHSELGTPELTHAALFMAHYSKSKNLFKEAERYAFLVQDGSSAEKEDAKALLRELCSLMK